MIGKTISHYRITEKLGQGGMGEVFLADDLSLGRKVALKFLPENLRLDPVAHRRLLREARSAASLDHPYICHINEVGETDGTEYIVMEHVEGETLKDKLAGGPLPRGEALQLAAEMAEALEAAHHKGIVHRDLKPVNIMVTPAGHVKVMDFGLAQQLVQPDTIDTREETRTSLTHPGMIVGTPSYLSPEQAKAKSTDGRSDIFSFGIILYEMLTGIHPFQRETLIETVSAILSETPPPLDQTLPDAPEQLTRMVGRMLAKDSALRHQSMQEVRADLRQLLPGGIWKPCAQRPAIRWWRPQSTPSALVVLATLLLLLGATGWLVHRYFKSPATALAFQERDWILITDFENSTGETVFDGSLDTAMAVSMQQSRYVNIFPRPRVQETLKRMRWDGARKLDEGLGREVALREGVKGLLVCSIGKIGNEYLLAARLVDPNTQMAVYSQSSTAQGKDQVLGALDLLSEKVRHELGESMARISRQRVPLLNATTSSLEALKSLTAARRSSGTTAIQLLRHAIELDPDFALAHVDLGLLYYLSNDRSTGEVHFQKAMSLLDRLTIREKLWILALVEDWRGNREQGITNYRTYLAEYPDDLLGWFRLGYALMITNREVPAIEAYQKVLGIDPSNSGAYINLATCNQSLGNDHQAVSNYEKAFQLNPAEVTGYFVNQEYGFLLVKMGKTQSAKGVFEKMLAQDDTSKKARGYRSLALLNMYQGKYSAARELLNEAILINKAGKFKLSEMRDHLFLASISQAKGEAGGFEREMSAVKQVQKEIRVEPYFLYLTGRLYARLGRLSETTQLLDTLSARLGDIAAVSAVNRSNRADQAYQTLLKGEAELTRKRYGSALEFFGLAAKLDEDVSCEPLAYGYRQSGNLELAAREYERFLKINSLGSERQELWVNAHYQLGRIYEEKKEPEKATAFYQRLLDLWREADPDLPLLHEVKQRLEALRRTAVKNLP